MKACIKRLSGSPNLPQHKDFFMIKLILNRPYFNFSIKKVSKDKGA